MLKGNIIHLFKENFKIFMNLFLIKSVIANAFHVSDHYIIIVHHVMVIFFSIRYIIPVIQVVQYSILLIKINVKRYFIINFIQEYSIIYLIKYNIKIK